MVDRGLDRHDAGIGDETVRGLHAVAAGIGRRHADRAALVAADRHLDLAGADERRAARRGAAGRVAVFVRIVHGAQRGGVAAAGQAEIFAMRLADDGAAGVEDAGNDGRIDVGHVAFECRGAVHHRHAGEADIILEDDALARQRSVRGAAHFGLHRPGIERVFVGAWPVAGCAWVAHRRQIVGQLIDPIVGLEGAFQHLQVFGDFALRHAQVQ